MLAVVCKICADTQSKIAGIYLYFKIILMKDAVKKERVLQQDGVKIATLGIDFGS